MFSFDYFFASYNPETNNFTASTTQSEIDIEEIYLNFNTLSSFADYLPTLLSVAVSSSFIPISAVLLFFTYSYAGVIPVWLGRYFYSIFSTVGYENLFPVVLELPYYRVQFRVNVLNLIHDVENYNFTEEQRSFNIPLMYKTKNISKKLVFIDGVFYYEDFYNNLKYIQQNTPWVFYFKNYMLHFYKKELRIDMPVGIGSGRYPYSFIVPFRAYGYI